MATLREWLDEERFDWATGVIVAHKCTESSYSPGWGDAAEAYLFDFRGNAPALSGADPLLDQEFHSGYGAPECPRIVAEDKDALYFPSQYDGATNLEKVMKDLRYYLDPKNETPYPGG